MNHEPRVYVSRVIPGAPDDVWDRIRDFDTFDEWGPGPVEDCAMEDGAAPTEVGGVRQFHVGDRTVKELLVAHSDEERFYQYTMVEGADGKENYLGELRLIPITESGETLAVYFVHFDVDESEMDDAVSHLEKVFGGALQGLHDEFA